jgi:hypothetical protein
MTYTMKRIAMTTPTGQLDQLVQFTQRSQEAFGALLRAWQNATATTTAATLPEPHLPLPDLQVTVDAAFDYAARVLHDQREFTKALVAVGIRTVETVAEQATHFSESAIAAARDTAHEATREPTRQAEAPQSTTAEIVPVKAAPVAEAPADTKPEPVAEAAPAEPAKRTRAPRNGTKG